MILDGADQLRANDEQIKPIIFDPILEWGRISKLVEKEMTDAQENPTFDNRVNREKKHIKELANRLIEARVVEDYSEVAARLHGANEAAREMKRIQELNSRIFDGFDIEEIIDLRTLAELIGLEIHYRYVMAHWRETKQIDEKWEPTPTKDALTVSSGLVALSMKENIPLGRKAVDLGGGDGTWGFVLAQLGFEVTLIERDERLIFQYERKKRKLENLSIKTGQISTIKGEFHLEEEKNTPEIIAALRNANIVTCYPWPEEVEDRMKLFKKYAKDDAVLVFYGGALDGFSVNSMEIKKAGLEVVGDDINKELEKKPGVSRWIRGYNTTSSAASWLVLKKTQLQND